MLKDILSTTTDGLIMLLIAGLESKFPALKMLADAIKLWQEKQQEGQITTADFLNNVATEVNQKRANNEPGFRKVKL
jgi:hypothetical protein